MEAREEWQPLLQDDERRAWRGSEGGRQEDGYGARGGGGGWVGEAQIEVPGLQVLDDGDACDHFSPSGYMSFCIQLFGSNVSVSSDCSLGLVFVVARSKLKK